MIAPEGTEEDAAKEGNLKALHHLLSFFTEDFVKAVVAAAEVADRDAKEEAKAKANSNSLIALLDAKDSKGTWAEEREKAEAERRKIDPSCLFFLFYLPEPWHSADCFLDSDATYNTARAEVALAWLTAVILPEKEEEEKLENTDRDKEREKGKGKGKGKGKAKAVETDESDLENYRAPQRGSGSTSRAGEEE